MAGRPVLQWLKVSTIDRLFGARFDKDAAVRDSASAADVVCNVLFLILLAANVMRTLRHAMWRDELQVFQLGTGSNSLSDLFRHLKYEAHGSLWEGLIWLITRVTADPAWMQVLQAVLAAAVWIVIYRWSPFSRAEKFLLLLGYFLFFEYFVISRSYVLVALLGFAFVAIRQHQPGQVIVAWLLLGLLANLVMHATIWSVALAAVFAIEQRERGKAFYAGAAAYLACLAFGIATMIPAADFGPWGRDVGFDPERLNRVLVVPLGALMPFNPDWIRAALEFASGAATAAPSFWNPVPLSVAAGSLQANVDHPLRFALVLAAPLALCWLVTRERLRLLEFAIAYAGILAFATLWNFPGSSRHNGIVFLALLVGAWLARAESAGDRWSRWTLRSLLLVSAVGGVLTLASELRPFSQARDAAQWLDNNNLSSAFLIGSRDAQASSVAGYLGRPVYYLECQCMGRFIIWNHGRQSPLSPDEFRSRLSRAASLAAGDAILIRNRPLLPDELPPEGSLSAKLLKSLTGTIETDENYWIYRVTRP
jgi:hypothetical protein